MTDKELRKLSRLELLELLLEASKENHKLKEEIVRLKGESRTAHNIENLSAITQQVENSLRYVTGLADKLNTASVKGSAPSEIKGPTADKKISGTDPLSDAGIYKRMLIFFADNDDSLGVFPSDLENDVRARIRSILDKRK